MHFTVQVRPPHFFLQVCVSAQNESPALYKRFGPLARYNQPIRITSFTFIRALTYHILHHRTYHSTDANELVKVIKSVRVAVKQLCV